MKTRNFAALAFTIGVLLGLLIYWREVDAREHVNLFHVLLWQIGIWLPWVLGFIALGGLIKRTDAAKYKSLQLFGFCTLLAGLHFGWFFFLSKNFSPYIGQYGCRFGVYRYFFIFWTLIDVGLIWFIVDKLKGGKNKELPPPLLLELTRGGNKYFCDPTQIMLLVAENYYTKLFTTEGIFVMRKPLKSFQDILPLEVFKKIHRSTIINVNYVSELAKGNNNGLEVIMKDGTRRKVSRNFVKEINVFFKNRTY